MVPGSFMVVLGWSQVVLSRSMSIKVVSKTKPVTSGGLATLAR